MLDRVRALNEIAQRRGQKLAQLALQWALRDPRVTSAVIGASSVEQLDTNLDALDCPALTDDELAEIDRYAVESGVNLWAENSDRGAKAQASCRETPRSDAPGGSRLASELIGRRRGPKSSRHVIAHDRPLGRSPVTHVGAPGSECRRVRRRHRRPRSASVVRAEPDRPGHDHEDLVTVEGVRVGGGEAGLDLEPPGAEVGEPRLGEARPVNTSPGSSKRGASAGLDGGHIDKVTCPSWIVYMLIS